MGRERERNEIERENEKERGRENEKKERGRARKEGEGESKNKKVMEGARTKRRWERANKEKVMGWRGRTKRRRWRERSTREVYERWIDRFIYFHPPQLLISCVLLCPSVSLRSGCLLSSPSLPPTSLLTSPMTSTQSVLPKPPLLTGAHTRLRAHTHTHFGLPGTMFITLFKVKWDTSAVLLKLRSICHLYCLLPCVAHEPLDI